MNAATTLRATQLSLSQTARVLQATLDRRSGKGGLPQPRRVGVHGARNAGKTCYLGCLYGFRVGEGASLTFTDGDTINYLRDVWAELGKQQLPPATRGEPTDLRAEIAVPAEKLAWPLQLRDYPGALVQPTPRQATPLDHELTEGVRQWFRSCHALLILVDSSQPDLAQFDALDLLLTELHKGRYAGRSLERPLGLVLTKWDRQGPISDDSAAEEERARAYLQSQPVFRQLARKLEEAGDWFRVFPVSAFGRQTADDRPPPPEQLSPYNLHAPLVWAAQRADELLLEEARRTAQKALDRSWKFFGRPLAALPNHRRAVKAFKDLRRDYGLRAGPVAEEIDQEIRSLRDARWRREWRWWGEAVAVVVVVAGVLGLLGWYKARHAYAELETFRQHHPGRDQASAREEKELAFLDSWWSRVIPDLRGRVWRWYFADAHIASEQSRSQATRTQAPELERQHRMREALALYQDFNRDFPNSPDHADFESRVAALVPTIEDLTEYEAFCQEAQKLHEPAALETARRRSEEYLATTHAPRRMREAVGRWRAWFDGLQTETDCSIVVESLSISPGSDLDTMLGTKPRVIVDVNGTVHATDWARGNHPIFNAELGPYRVRWGQPGTLRVRVETSRWYPVHNRDAERTVTDERFILCQANGPVQIECKKGKAATVVLRCPRAAPPELPSYFRD